MRLTRLVLTLSFGSLVACGGSKKPATMPGESAAAPAPTGGAEAADDAAPAEGTQPEPAMAPGAPPAPTPAASESAPAPKPVTRGATKRSEDPDAGGE